MMVNREYRKIKNGRIKWRGRWYVPKHEYNGELDGMYMIFVDYVGRIDILYMYPAEDFTMFDGKFNWEWWEIEEIPKEEK